MFFYEGQTCPVCGKRFNESDDVVACPACGCPHHRDCWKQEGHCHFAADHGTERQWAQGRDEAEEVPQENPTRRCPNCGTENPEFAEFCARCGRDLECEDWESAPHDTQYTPPVGNDTPPFTPPHDPWLGQPPFQQPFRDPYGGLDRNERIGDFTVNELVDVIDTNSEYYLPRFKQMAATGSKASWNNAAFFFRANWLLYRKNIGWGIVFAAVNILLQVLLQIFIPEANTGAQLTSPQMLLYAILTMAELAYAVIVGLFGNYLYMLLVFRKARKNRENPKPLHERTFLEKGGVSFALFMAPVILAFFVSWIAFVFFAAMWPY